MKKVYMIFAVTLLLALGAYGISAPFPTWLTFLYGDVTFMPTGEAVLANSTIEHDMLQSMSTEDIIIPRRAHFEYDISGGDSGVVGSRGLGVYLPAGAIITSSYYNILTAFTAGDSSGTLAIYCEDANNIRTAAQITPTAAGVNLGGVVAPGATAGQFGGTSGTIAAECQISVSVGNTALTAGKLGGIVEYFLAD